MNDIINEDDAEFDADEKARIAALHKSAPETIWLQIDPEGEQFDGWEATTWCSDQINDSDLNYVRSDLVEGIKQQLAEARSERGHAYQLATELEQQRDEWKAEAIYLRGLSAETVAGQELAIVKQQRDELLAAAENLVRVKGRHHTEQAYKQLKAAVAKVSK